MVAKAANCRHCGAVLSLLQQSAGHCGAAGCRHRNERERWARLSVPLARQALDAATPQLAGHPATVLWLIDTEARLAPVPKATREAHRAHLQALLDAPPGDAVQPLPPAPPPSSPGQQAGRLCAQCRGRCCAPGGPNHAFITLPLLLRWQQREPGRTLQDAVDWFMAQIPPRHTRRACIYQGPQGCALPQGDRSDICNEYACDALVQACRQLADAPQAAFVAVTLAGDQAVRRALITADTTLPL